MPKTKVLFAYCAELGRSVSIDEARIAFFSQDKDRRKRYTFSCSDRQRCDVSITGVNYHVKAEDGQKYKAAHFRSHVPHKPGCEWLQFTEEEGQKQQAGESDAEFKERKSRQKLTDAITSFDPGIGDVTSQPARLEPSSGGTPSDASADRSGSNTDNSRWSNYTRTNQLQRLVDFWQEAKKELSDEEFQALRINIVNHGKVSLCQYISHIKNGLANPSGGVIYGGARLLHRYGKGFLMEFIDKVDDKPVRLYVSKDVMNHSGFSHYVDEILSAENVRYFRLFLLNPVATERDDRTGKRVVNLEISKLRQLAIYCELYTNVTNGANIRPSVEM